MAGINSTPTNFYVYLHRRKTDGKVFYVGKGHDKRAWTTDGRNQYWFNIVKKHGFYIEILLNNIQAWYAFELEKETILSIGRENLCNLTDGGEGSLNPSEETRKKLSIFQKTRKRNPDQYIKLSLKTKGMKRTKEQIDKMKLSKPLNFKHSIETKIKIGLASKNRIRKKESIAKTIAKTSKSVICITTSQIFKSRSEAARSLNLSISCISRVCNGIIPHTKGMIFKNENP